MAQLKQVTMRLKSIKNIQKITKTMKMVSASKFAKAERELQQARPFGYGPRKFYESALLIAPDKQTKSKESKDSKGPEPAPPPPDVPGADTSRKKKRKIYIAITSDRGLCGGVHSGIARKIRRYFLKIKATDEHPYHKLICVGDKSRSMLRRQFSDNMLVSAKEIGRIAPVFVDAAKLSTAVMEAHYPYDQGDIYYNKYHTPVKYVLTIVPFFSKASIVEAPNMHIFDEIEDDELECFSEFTLASLMYYVLKECAASEQSARMAAMDSATKNAGDMIRKLTLLFNRTRQAVITKELIEIISGAAALK